MQISQLFGNHLGDSTLLLPHTEDASFSSHRPEIILRFLRKSCLRQISVMINGNRRGKHNLPDGCRNYLMNELVCRSCGTRLRVPEGLMGRTFACPRCKTPVPAHLGSPSEEPEVPDQVVMDPEPLPAEATGTARATVGVGSGGRTSRTPRRKRQTNKRSIRVEVATAGPDEFRAKALAQFVQHVRPYGLTIDPTAPVAYRLSLERPFTEHRNYTSGKFITINAGTGTPMG